MIPVCVHPARRSCDAAPVATGTAAAGPVRCTVEGWKVPAVVPTSHRLRTPCNRTSPGIAPGPATDPGSWTSTRASLNVTQ